ncbi:MAG: acyl-CoA synthetase [Candidatus Hodarchaeales archaeon]|jgi:fatty-acyl-CoA synthase
MEKKWSWVGDWSGRRANLSPDKIAIIDDTTGLFYTFYDLDNRANKLAFILKDYGIKKGDRVLLFSRNRIECIDLFLAIGKIGAILVPLNIRLTTPEIKYLLNKTTPRIFIYDSSLKQQIKSLKRDIPLTKCIALGEDPLDNDPILHLLMEDAPLTKFKKQALDFNDPHLILFTGGTTGLPKGAILSHRLIFWNSVNTITTWSLQSDDIQPLLFPLFHTGGWNVLLVPFFHLGAQSILMGDFDPDRTLKVIKENKCSIVIGVPTMFQIMAQSEIFTSATFDSVRVFISGGAPCPLSIMEKYWEKNKPFKMGYGLTEVGPNNFYLPDNEIKRKPLSVGFPVFHCDMKIVDDDNKNVPPGEVGELCLRGPHIFSGYWEDSEETNKTIDLDGWVHTGDLARIDDEGFYYIVDRKKDMFISGGENVFPVEIEEILYKHPAVLEVAVFGIPDEKWGEIGVAAIAQKPSVKIKENELKQLLEKNLARYKHPKHIKFYEELPKSAAGKILRRKVKNSYLKD